jgi:GxxExxY protein
MRSESLRSAGFQQVSSELNDLSRVILDSAFAVHKSLGPGLLETTYRLCLLHELRKRGMSVEQEVALPITYDGVTLESGYRIDLLVNDLIVIELKAVDSLLAIHQAQLLSYLKHSGKRLGLLINFNSILLKDGIRRVICG